MTNSDDSTVPILSEMRKAMRQLSSTRLSSFTGKSGVVIADDPNPNVIRSHWMSLIIGVSSHVNVTFRVQFMSKDIAGFSDNSNLNDRHVIDFGKEFCNLTLGGVKSLFENHNISLGTSLPLFSRGFDSIYFPRKSSGTTDFDSWSLRLGDSEIFCDSFIELFKPFPFKFEENLLTDVDGSVELF